ncbi:MAG: RNA-binding protein [Pseudomonadota bacterium]
MKIYVGNLPWNTTDQDLSDTFSKVGDVTSATVITDRETGRSRGFGFVEMADADGQRAIEELNGQELGGRPMRVNEANERRRRW